LPRSDEEAFGDAVQDGSEREKAGAVAHPAGVRHREGRAVRDRVQDQGGQDQGSAQARFGSLACMVRKTDGSEADGGEHQRE
jgi:hypothetical protein